MRSTVARRCGERKWRKARTFMACSSRWAWSSLGGRRVANESAIHQNEGQRAIELEKSIVEPYRLRVPQRANLDAAATWAVSQLERLLPRQDTSHAAMADFREIEGAHFHAVCHPPKAEQTPYSQAEQERSEEAENRVEQWVHRLRYDDDRQAACRLERSLLRTP